MLRGVRLSSEQLHAIREIWVSPESGGPRSGGFRRNPCADKEILGNYTLDEMEDLEDHVFGEPII